MNFVQMKCPNCGANLDVETGIDSFFCKYCGTKIIVEGQSKTAYTAKTVNNIANRLLDQRQERLARQAEERRKEAEHARKMAPYILIGSVVLMIALFVFIYIMANLDSSSEPTAAQNAAIETMAPINSSTPKPAESPLILQDAIDTINGIQSEVQGVADAYNDLMDTFKQFTR